MKSTLSFLKRINHWYILAGVAMVFWGTGRTVQGFSSIFPTVENQQEGDTEVAVVTTVQPTVSHAAEAVPTHLPTVQSGFVADAYISSEDLTSNPYRNAVAPLIPDRIVIPAIKLEAPVVLAQTRKIKVGESVFDQWKVPNQFAAGWHTTSAYLGQRGNTVINGHHNEYGEVFKNLINLKVGDRVFLYSGGREFAYEIVNKMVLPEREAPVETRLQNARWISTSKDERVTLVTCWPYVSNTHRLIIVASRILIEDRK